MLFIGNNRCNLLIEIVCVNILCFILWISSKDKDKDIWKWCILILILFISLSLISLISFKKDYRFLWSDDLGWSARPKRDNKQYILKFQDPGPFNSCTDAQTHRFMYIVTEYQNWHNYQLDMFPFQLWSVAQRVTL